MHLEVSINPETRAEFFDEVFLGIREILLLGHPEPR